MFLKLFGLVIKGGGGMDKNRFGSIDLFLFFIQASLLPRVLYTGIASVAFSLRFRSGRRGSKLPTHVHAEHFVLFVLAGGIPINRLLGTSGGSGTLVRPRYLRLGPLRAARKLYPEASPEVEPGWGGEELYVLAKLQICVGNDFTSTIVAVDRFIVWLVLC